MLCYSGKLGESMDNEKLQLSAQIDNTELNSIYFNSEIDVVIIFIGNSTNILEGISKIFKLFI